MLTRLEDRYVTKDKGPPMNRSRKINAFRITGHLWEDPPVIGAFPWQGTVAGNRFFWPEYIAEQTADLSVICDTIMLRRCQSNATRDPGQYGDDYWDCCQLRIWRKHLENFHCKDNLQQNMTYAIKLYINVEIHLKPIPNNSKVRLDLLVILFWYS